MQNEDDWPVLAPIVPPQAVEGVPFVMQVRATDPDLEPRLLDGRPVDPMERLVFSTDSSRVPIDPESGIINFTPTNDDAMLGDIRVVITVTDLWDRTSSEVILFHILNINDPPTNLAIVGVAPGQHIHEGQTYSLSGNATDIDNVAGQLGFLWYTEDEFVGEGRTIQWKVEGHGRMTLELRVSDNAGGYSKTSVTLEVEPVRQSPCRSPVVLLSGFIIVAAITVAMARRRGRR